jgi:hypothetical protein
VHTSDVSSQTGKIALRAAKPAKTWLAPQLAAVIQALPQLKKENQWLGSEKRVIGLHAS